MAKSWHVAFCNEMKQDTTWKKVRESGKMTTRSRKAHVKGASHKGISFLQKPGRIRERQRSTFFAVWYVWIYR
jgi:hypothetical protein